MRYVVTFSIMSADMDEGVTLGDVLSSVKGYIREADAEQIAGMVECAVISEAPPLMVDGG